MKFRWHIRAARALSLAGTLALGACDVHDRLLDVQTPDIVDPGNTQSIAGAQSYYTAAVGDFSRFIGGDRGGGSPLGLNLTGGLLADEIFSARAGTESIDNRSINFNNFPIDSWTRTLRLRLAFQQKCFIVGSCLHHQISRVLSTQWQVEMGNDT